MRQNPSAIFMYRIDSGEIVEANAAAVTLYGFSHKKLRQMTVYDLKAHFEQGGNDAGYVGGAPLIFSHRRCDGSIFPVEILWGVYYWGDTSYGYIVCRDVS